MCLSVCLCFAPHVSPSNLSPGGDKFLAEQHSDILVTASVTHTHKHTHTHILQPPDTHTHLNIQSLIPQSLICAPVSGRGVE